VRVPAHNIDVTVVGLPRNLTLLLGSSKIPKLDGLIDRAGGQHVLLRWAPLDVLNARLVPLKSNLGFFDEA